MKAIVLMFDSLNRHFLPPYGCDWTHAPNFRRLAERTATFDRSYVCSMPCMPARREFHTGRPNLLHRSWGPMEPFDDSMPAMLKGQGTHTHLATDHYHYFEDGGCTYHPRYQSWECFRGQEGDPFIGQVDPTRPIGYAVREHDALNRQYMRREEDQPQAKTLRAGIEFIDRNHDQDNWMLHIETFDPHEPFFSQRQYKDLYREHYEHYRGEAFDWPPYGKVQQAREVVEHVRYEYASLLSMCDARLGDVLDTMDKYDMWQDTMLAVWTDHGFMLGEHESWAKCWLPFFEEISHTPFFLWDPRHPEAAGTRRQALVQPALDLAPTLLNYFGMQPTSDMLGHDLSPVMAADTPQREGAIFGLHGGHVNVTDGRYVYMRGPASKTNQPLYDYTVMPTHMKGMFKVEELRTATMAEPFGFTKECPVMRIDVSKPWAWDNSPTGLPTMLFDLATDPQQQTPITDPDVEARMTDLLVTLMRECEAPAEQYERLGLA